MSVADYNRGVRDALKKVQDLTPPAGEPALESLRTIYVGERSVLWHSPSEETVSVGINRAPESGIDCGGLVLGLLNDSECGVGPVEYGELVYLELCTWYRHPSGFFAGRGTRKAPDLRPLATSIETIAVAIDATWLR